MGVFYFPTNFVYWRKVPDHDSLKNWITELLNKNPECLKDHSLVSNGLSTHSNATKHFSEEVQSHDTMLKSVVWDTLHELIEELNSRPYFERVDINGVFINSFWFSVYDENSFVSCHNHASEGRDVSYINGKKYVGSLSLIYVVNDKNDKNQTVFIQPSNCGVNLYRCLETRFDTSMINEIGEGTVLIFPSNLQHEVKKIVKPGRIIFSANLSASFD